MTDSTSTTDLPPSLYEGMFLMTQQASNAGLSEAMDVVRQILDRAGAEVVTLGKWEDRKLAYPIKGQKRGSYLLSLFRVDGVQIANIERDCNLGEQVLRVMIVRADHLGETELDLAREAAEKSQVEAKLTDDRDAKTEKSEPKAEVASPAVAEAEPVTSESSEPA